MSLLIETDSVEMISRGGCMLGVSPSVMQSLLTRYSSKSLSLVLTCPVTNDGTLVVFENLATAKDLKARKDPAFARLAEVADSLIFGVDLQADAMQLAEKRCPVIIREFFRHNVAATDPCTQAHGNGNACLATKRGGEVHFVLEDELEGLLIVLFSVSYAREVFSSSPP